MTCCMYAVVQLMTYADIMSVERVTDHVYSLHSTQDMYMCCAKNVYANYILAGHRAVWK